MRTRIEKFRRQYGSLLVGLAFYSFMAVMGFLTIIASEIGLENRATRIPVRLLSAEGIRSGTPVYVNGVEAGSVHSLYYVTLGPRGELRPWREAGPSHGQTVIAILTFKERPTIYPNYRLISRYLSILGAKVIELNPGTAFDDGAPRHLALDYLELSLTDVAAYRASGKLPEDNRPMVSATNYDDPIYLVAEVLRENRNDVLAITTSLREITEKLNYGEHNIALLVNDARLADGTNRFLTDVNSLVGDAQAGVEDLRESRAYIDFLSVLVTVAGAFVGG
ncbi:MAG: MlaD family protein [Leptospirales bacterium]|nr:MlaD family protein [Leptospirales bacterium]